MARRSLVRRAARRVRRHLGARLVARAGIRSRLPHTAGVALTFDDGPDPDFTPQVLSTLSDAGVTATFFLVGRAVERHPELARRIVAEGHQIASHSWSHPDPAVTGLADLVRDYRRGRRALERVVGGEHRMFRPPMGHVDARGAIAMRVAGLRPWLWTIDPQDWRSDVDRDDIVGQVVTAGAGDVVLLHDGLATVLAESGRDRTPTVTAVPDIVRTLLDRGQRLVPLPP